LEILHRNLWGGGLSSVQVPKKGWTAVTGNFSGWRFAMVRLSSPSAFWVLEIDVSGLSGHSSLYTNWNAFIVNE
jgi:heme O synthase-like polyprenyltransferase